MSSTTQFDLDCLIEQGRHLSNLVYKAGWSKDKRAVVEKAEDIVTIVLNAMKNASGEADFPEECIKTLVKKIEESLEILIRHDRDNKWRYEDLLEELHEFLHPKSESASITPSLPISPDDIDSSREPEFDTLYSQLLGDDNQSGPEFDTLYRELSGDEKQRLRCFLLFPVEAIIKRREIIHCWVGLGLTNSLVGEHQLGKLVGTGLIEREILNKKLLNRYKMPKVVHNKLQELDQESNLITKEGSWSILHAKKEQQSRNNAALQGSRLWTLTRSVTFTSSLLGGNVDPEALLNVNSRTLNAAQFKTLSGMHKLKVVHLGSWKPKRYNIVTLEDVESLKYLKNLKEVVFLSLADVSGIEKLPEVVYELRQLKVLDLRECSDLEILPPGIETLMGLTHLDLSGCYLLDHIPLGITFLTNLHVLKGFIVNENQDAGKDNIANRTSGSSPCPFAELSKLNQLRKLTILNRRNNFPTNEDLQTLCEMEQLSRLRIVWMRSFSNADKTLTEDDHLNKFPATLTKLDLQGALEHTVTRLIRLISEDKNNSCLEKLYIRGGGLRELKHLLAHPKIVRLRYLHQLKIQWHDFAKLFPNLSSLEIFDCPNLNSFPCDAYGMWENPC